MDAESIVRALGGRWGMARCPAHQDGSPSLSVTARGGKVLVHCHAGCTQADVIAALRSRGLWPERERRTWTPAERARSAAERRHLEHDLPLARCWRRSALCFAEAELELLKAALFDPNADPVLHEAILNDSIYKQERMLNWFGHLDGAELAAEYRWWTQHHPQLTGGMIHAAHEREMAEKTALMRYMGIVETDVMV